MKEKLESYFKEHIKVEGLIWEINDHEGEVWRLTFTSDYDFCFSWDFLEAIHKIFPYRVIVCEGKKFKFAG